MIRQRTSLWLGVSCLLAPLTGLAGTLPSSFSLGRYVPADWWMYMHFADNPERAWIEQRWEDVWDTLAESGIDKDILAIVSALGGESGQAEIQTVVDTVKEILGGVRWGDLVKREFVFAERIGKPMPEYLALVRSSPWR